MLFRQHPYACRRLRVVAHTIRRRLAGLEEIGVITGTPQWLDAQGQRKGTGPGRRTSDLIRLMVPGISPPLALQQSSHCGQGLISEPEPEKNIGLVEVRDEEALAAWDAYGRETTGKTYPRNRRRRMALPEPVAARSQG
jgi:hypothetical protein